ncbi:MAG: autotransporter domain-containing protein, partial [Akkermansia sp.]|nr:autotransporter domain-containing protein [Akkermansia sp.]
GDITVNGDLLKGSTVKLIDKTQRVTLKGGAMAGTISGIGRVDIDGEVDITAGKLTAEQVYLNGTLTHAKGWTLTKGQTLTLGVGKVEGNLVVATGSVLDFNNYTLAAAPELKGGTLDMGAASSISISGSKASITLGKQGVNVTAKGTIFTDKALEVTGGTVTLTALDGYNGDLIAEGGSTLKISTGKLAVDNDIIVKGSAVLNNGSTHSGDITVNGDLLKGSTIKLIDKTQRVTLNGGAVCGTISGIGRVDVNGSVDFTQGKLTAEQIYVNSGGRLVNTKAWTLAKGQTLAFAGGSMEVGAKGLSTAAGSTLRLQQSGTLNGSLTLGGGELVYYGNSPLTVTGTLTLSKATTLTMTGDLVKGTTYTLFKCNDIVTTKTFDAAAFFNNKDVVVNMEASAITVTYNGATMHTTSPSSLVREPEPEETEEAVGEDLPTRNALMATTAPAGTPAMAGEELPEVEEETTVEAPQEGVVLVTTGQEREPQAAVADAMVQADWGAANAGRAFTGTLGGRHQSLRALGTGRTAVWADTIFSHTRQSSAHGHAGADSNLYGAALGVEFNAGAHAAAGLALGHTWNRVETFRLGRVKQDTQHAGAFGRARVFNRGAHSLWLEGSAAYGKTESRATLGGDTRERWTQDGATFSVHANDVVQVGESTALNLFAGLEYLATDSGRIGSVHTGSVQNLRAELGGGITHTVGRGMVFAEAALLGDMVRHNPEATIGGKYSGANPGRIGAGITVGGAYALGERWSLNASYTFQGARHNNSHSVDLGASCRF